MANPIPLESYPQRSLRDFYYILFRHKWKIISFFLAVMVTVTVGTFLAPRVYRAQANLLLRVGRENVSLDPTATTGQTMSLGFTRESEINSELDILKSRELAETVVDAIGPEAFLKGSGEGDSGNASKRPNWWIAIGKNVGEVKRRLAGFRGSLSLSKPLPDRENAIMKLTGALKIETQKNTNTFSLSYEDSTPKGAQDALAKVIEIYLQKHITVHRTSGSYEFFEGQSERLRSDVAKLEEDLRNLKNRTGVTSLEDQRRVILNRIANLRQENESTQAALAISKAKVRSLKQDLAKLSPTVVTQETKGTSNQAADLMRSKLYDLQMKEQDLLSKYKETSLPAREVRRQIAEAQEVLSKEDPTRTQITTAINTTYQQLDLALITETATLQSLESKANVLKGQLEEASREVQDLNNTELKMVSLQRELTLHDAKYRKYSENREQARIDQALEQKKISNISVVQKATASMKPVKPRKELNLALGFFLAIFGGLGIAFFFEHLDHSIKTPQDVEEKLKSRLLASIPYLKRNKALHGQS